MIVQKTSVFPASRKTIFENLLKLETLQYIAFPYATFTPLDVDFSFKWGVGTTSSYKFKLFGFLPMGTHTIRIERFDEKTGVSSKEGNKFVPVWNHVENFFCVALGKCVLRSPATQIEKAVNRVKQLADYCKCPSRSAQSGKGFI
jgi:hypothetical protein